MTRSGMKTISIINYTVGKSLLITLLSTISVDSAYNYFCQMHVNRHLCTLYRPHLTDRECRQELLALLKTSRLIDNIRLCFAGNFLPRGRN